MTDHIPTAALLAALNAHADATRDANGYPPGPHAPDLHYYGQITRDAMEAALQAAWATFDQPILITTTPPADPGEESLTTVTYQGDNGDQHALGRATVHALLGATSLLQRLTEHNGRAALDAVVRALGLDVATTLTLRLADAIKEARRD